MAKHKQHTNRPNVAQKPAPPQKKTSLNGPFKLSVHVFVVSGIAIVNWLFLKVCLLNEIDLWDDTPYIRENRLVKNISWEGIRDIFTTPSMGNYHPLTMLSYAIEYSYVQLEPWLYHFDNLLLHVFVVALVYWLVMLLTRRTVAAVITALLFGLHPMHMESVAWAASRKDVLCGVFYMAACIMYIYYHRSVRTRKWIWYGGVFVLYTCSLLSKAVAVTLPLTLLLIDYFENRRLGKKMLVEKIPHFILALVFGIIAIKAQHLAGAMEMQTVSFNLIERIPLGAYALTTYLWKAIAPVQLHCLYPYPAKVGGTLPYVYYIYPAIIAALAFLFWKYLRKNKVAVFGMLFFLVNIALLLQFMPVGDAVIAERYTYIPYFGLFFIAGWYVSGFFESGANRRYRSWALGGALLYIGCLGYLSSERCTVWHDEISLWRDEIEKEPVRGIKGYNNLGYFYSMKLATDTDPDEKKALYDSAYYFMNKAIQLEPNFVNPYLALGEMQRTVGRYDEARHTYYNALQNCPGKINVNCALAILYYTEKNMDSAGYYFRAELQITQSAESYGNYANYLGYMGKDDSALAEYNKAIPLSKDDYVPYMNRGTLLKKMNRWNDARRDYENAIKISPDNGQLYYLRSFCDTQSKDIPKAIADVEKAISLGYNTVDMNYYNGLKNK